LVDSSKLSKQATKTKKDKKKKINRSYKGLDFYKELISSGADNLKKKLTDALEVQKILKQKQYVTSNLYIQTASNEYSLFLGLSGGAAMWYKFKQPNFAGKPEVVVVIDVEKCQPSITALAYDAKTKKLYLGKGNKEYENKTTTGWYEFVFFLNMTDSYHSWAKGAGIMA